MAEDGLPSAEPLAKSGDADFLRAVAGAVLQMPMGADVEGPIGAARHERTAERPTYRNGCRGRTLGTRLGAPQLRIPKPRQGSYLPPSLEPRKATGKALVAMIQEAWTGGVSTRRVDDLAQAMGLAGISKSTVSKSCKDMISVRVGPDMRMAVVGAPSYFATRPRPKTPQDLTAHNCINLRLPTHGGLYAWEFEKNRRELNVRAEGQLVFNTAALMLKAAVEGFGLAYLPEEQVQAQLDAGRLGRVLADWCPPFSGYHLYYPSRRQSTPAFALLVDALRYRG